MRVSLLPFIRGAREHGSMSHDQNFKNLIPDYPRQALAFFAEAEAWDLPREVRITPVREEQLQVRLGERPSPGKVCVDAGQELSAQRGDRAPVNAVVAPEHCGRPLVFPHLPRYRSGTRFPSLIRVAVKKQLGLKSK